MERQTRRRGIERRKRAQKRKKKLEVEKYKKDSAIQQQKITQYAISKYQVDPMAGNPITIQKWLEDIRMYLQNFNGVMFKDKRYNDRRALLSLREWDVDIISLPKTNQNWAKEWLRNKWRSEVQRVWQHAKVFFASIDQPTE